MNVGAAFISGAAGLHSARINGFYTVTEEKSSDGRVVLSKRGDASMCIEHFAGKGTKVCRARARVWAWPLFKAGVHWRTVRHAYGGQITEKSGKINPA